MDDSATLHLVGLRELVARACAETVVVRHGLLICSSLVTLRAAEGHASVRFRKIVRSSKYRYVFCENAALKTGLLHRELV